MVKHIVTFKLEGTSEERRKVAESFKSALLALPSSIDVLQSVEVVAAASLLAGHKSARACVDYEF